MIARRTLLWVAGAACAISGLVSCSPEPCSSCATIGGAYTETSIASTMDCGDGSYLYLGVNSSSDSAEAISLQQSNSSLSLNGTYGVMPGVLHTDLSASFGPVSATALPVTGDLTPDPSGTPTPGQMYLNGWFVVDPGGSVSFQGTYSFVATSDGCEVDSKTTWTSGGD